MTNAVDECRTGLGALSDFMATTAVYLTSGGTPPDAPGAVPSLDYSESLTFSLDQASQSAWFGTGVVQESLAYMAGATREIDMASLGKVSLFSGAASEYEQEALFYAKTRDFFIGTMRGVVNNGSQ